MNPEEKNETKEGIVLKNHKNVNKSKTIRE
jgi:hypothetical protein